MAEGNNLKITTNYTDDWIDQQVSLSGKMISRQVLYLQDTGVKEALVKLGWTPPQEERPAGKIYCGICGNEIHEIAIDLLSNITTACCNTCRDKIIILENQVKQLESQLRILTGWEKE